MIKQALSSNLEKPVLYKVTVDPRGIRQGSVDFVSLPAGINPCRYGSLAGVLQGDVQF